MGKKEKRLTVAQQINKKATEKIADLENDVTRKNYKNNIRKFVQYCRKNFDSKSLDECANHIQDYSDYLQSEEYTASTIHVYLASACRACGVCLANIKKPKRYTSEYIRGRTEPEYLVGCQDIDDSRWTYLVQFQRKVGLRRDELRRLTKNDYIDDESGHKCVYCRKGKGGKQQLQRILPEDIDFIKKYFDAVSDDQRIFPEELFRNKLNLHKLRSDFSKRAYYYYLSRIKDDPAYATVLKNEIISRWKKYNLNPKTKKPKPLNMRNFSGSYFLRGKNREYARQRGLPTCYDRLCLLAVSIFHLSHFRLDVTVESYILT